MDKEDLFWRLLTANFLLLVGIVCLLLAYMIFQGSALAAVCVYGIIVTPHQSPSVPASPQGEAYSRTPKPTHREPPERSFSRAARRSEVSVG